MGWSKLEYKMHYILISYILTLFYKIPSAPLCSMNWNARPNGSIRSKVSHTSFCVAAKKNYQLGAALMVVVSVCVCVGKHVPVEIVSGMWGKASPYPTLIECVCVLSVCIMLIVLLLTIDEDICTSRALRKPLTEGCHSPGPRRLEQCWLAMCTHIYIIDWN